MKAIRVHQFGEPEVLQLHEVITPAPAIGQVLVRLQAVGVNPVETYIRSGQYARLPELPYTPGGDGAGVVEAVGSDVTIFRPGDRVYTAGSITGTYAELTLCAANQVHRLPATASFSQGTALGVAYATAWRALVQRGQPRRGETVLIHGASGGVGTAAVQIARAQGLRVFGTASTPEGRQLVAAEGAAAVFDHGDAGYWDGIRAATDGRGVDIILEMLANVNLARDLTLLAPRGRVVVVGNRGTIEINPRDAMAREADIRGMQLFNATPVELIEVHTALIAGLTDGSLRPVIARELPLAEAAEAHRAVLRPGARGKIVLVP